MTKLKDVGDGNGDPLIDLIAKLHEAPDSGEIDLSRRSRFKLDPETPGPLPGDDARLIEQEITRMQTVAPDKPEAD